MALCPQHTFQVLTKRPQRMLDYITDPKTPGRVADKAKEHQLLTPQQSQQDHFHRWHLPNLQLGISAGTQSAANNRIPLLLQTPAAVRFVSCEPLLELVDLTTVCCLNRAMTQPGVPFNPVPFH